MAKRKTATKTKTAAKTATKKAARKKKPPAPVDPAPAPQNPPSASPPDGRLVWTANGATWTAASPKVPGRIYTVRPAPVSGCVATYTGQRGSCRFAGRRFPNTDAARIACAEIERDLEA